MSIGFVDFFGGAFVGGDAIFPASPLAEIEQLAALTAKRAVWIAGIFGFFVASRTFHQ